MESDTEGCTGGTAQSLHSARPERGVGHPRGGGDEHESKVADTGLFAFEKDDVADDDEGLHCV